MIREVNLNDMALPQDYFMEGRALYLEGKFDLHVLFSDSVMLEAWLSGFRAAPRLYAVHSAPAPR